MSIDTAASPGHDNAPAAAGDAGDQNAEQAGRQPAGTDDTRSRQRAEPLTREQYADAMRAGGPPIRADSPGVSRFMDDSGSGGPEDADAERASDRGREEGPDDRGADDPAVVLPDERDRAGPAPAEPLTREEYADAMRGNSADGDAEGPDAAQARDGPAATAAVTHFHAEFKDRPLDLYTDGTRWAAADTPSREGTVSEKGDVPGRLPTGEELVDSAGEGLSRLERLRRDVYEQSDDEIDVLEKDANIFHDVFSRPPASSYEGTPAQPHIYETQHSGIDAGTVATAIFTVGLVIDRAVRWAVEYYDKHAKGR